MDFERAQEIFSSDERIKVLHNGTPIWIENLDDDNNSATIKPLDGKFGTSQVPVNDLEEG
ncbi:MAG TPA: H-type small acid-soluble spore protein [Desulfotomaculum sp.]|nr:MAG: hypothetical protein VR67_07040 [Peptococcaceae bacterium BRH_c8a]KJS73585.1 MAG: hypothetical protein JL56_10875 [Desulfotomaculum sp. BICA1-6]HBX23110.1 H-type small acid-soluble spore protein [Desulfotomaculum sp.]